MDKNSTILIFGGSGLVGSAIIKNLRAKGYTNVIAPPSKLCDCQDIKQVDDMFNLYNPQYVIIAAAKVGGIKANNDKCAEFIRENLLIQTNIFTIAAANMLSIKRLIFLGSSCIYPKNCPQPIKEEYLLTGPLEETNQSYAIAKIAGVEMCRSFNKQYGTSFVALMPCNLYGDNDNYHPTDSHVIPGLIQKLHAKKEKKYYTHIYWGTGKPLREFLHANDLAEATVQLLFHPTTLPYLINVGSGHEVSIKDLVFKVAVTVGYQGTCKPNIEDGLDGTPRKILDCTLLKYILPNWQPKVGISEGLKMAYKDYLAKLS